MVLPADKGRTSVILDVDTYLEDKGFSHIWVLQLIHIKMAAGFGWTPHSLASV